MRIDRITELDHPADAVVDWLQRPGALVRLTPPSVATVEDPAAGGLEEGRVVAVRLGHPALPAALRPRWVIRHEQGRIYDPARAVSADLSPYRTADDVAAALERPAAHFVDRQLRGPFRSWRHEHTIAALCRSAAGTGGRTAIRDEIELELPGPDRLTEGAARAQIEANLDFRARQMHDDLAFWAERSIPAGRSGTFTVAMTGASGLVGTQLAALLRTGGIHVVPMRRVRRDPSPLPAEPSADQAILPAEILWDPDRGVLDTRDLASVDAVIHLAGAPISTRFTEKNKQRILQSRVRSTRTLARALADAASRGYGPRTLVQASAIGIYGAQRPGELLTEVDDGGTGFLAEVVRAWESEANTAASAGLRTVLVRTGIVLSDAGGALLPQLPLFLAGVGGRLTRADAVSSWITLDDLVRVYAHALLVDELAGPVNAVAPAPASAAAMAATIGDVLHRPSAVPVPSFGPKLVLGSEGAEELVQADQNVSDELLRASGFRAAHPRLEGALRHVLRR